MTTIAWDGQTLAADGRICQDDTICSDNYNKIFPIRYAYHGDHIIYIGFSGVIGDLSTLLRVFASLDTQEQGTPKELDGRLEIIKDMGLDEIEGESILIGRDYVYHLEGGSIFNLIQYDRSEKLGAGSGGSYARSAMLLGLNAVQAVKHAFKTDIGSGGNIRSVKIP